MKSLIFAAAGALLASAQRQVADFNSNWMFILGEQPGYNSSSSSCDFPITYSGLQCFGLNQVAATSEAECASSCCADWSCEIYQYCAAGQNCGGSTSPTAVCWQGQISQCQNSSGWVSYGRNASALPSSAPTPGPQPCPASPACADYDDSKWRGVNTPHDFIVEGTFTPTADRNHGYLPFNISCVTSLLSHRLYCLSAVPLLPFSCTVIAFQLYRDCLSAVTSS